MNDTVTGIRSNGKQFQADVVISGADYHHSETLLDKQYRQYSENYWHKKTYAPSSLLFYVGFNTKLENIEHHNLTLPKSLLHLLIQLLERCRQCVAQLRQLLRLSLGRLAHTGLENYVVQVFLFRPHQTPQQGEGRRYNLGYQIQSNL